MMILLYLFQLSGNWLMVDRNVRNVSLVVVAFDNIR